MKTIEAFQLLAFLAACLSFLALPFVPALREWRSPSDCDALPVPVTHSKDAAHFATVLRTQMVCEDGQGDEIERGNRDSGTIYEAARYDGVPDARLESVMSGGDMHLAPNSQVAQWAHADGVLQCGERCAGVGRLTSTTAIDMAKGCCFERLCAPIIRFADAPIRTAAQSEPVAGQWTAIRGVELRGAGTYRVRGDCDIPAGRRYVGSIIVEGVLSVGAGSIICGDVKARRGVLLGVGAHVEGAIICEGDIQFLELASATGPVVSERSVLLGAGARVGSEVLPSTVTAGCILAEAGSVAHGSVWAREMGVVWALS